MVSNNIFVHPLPGDAELSPSSQRTRQIRIEKLIQAKMFRKKLVYPTNQTQITNSLPGRNVEFFLTLNHVVIALAIGHHELRRRIYRQKRCWGEGGGGVWGE